MAVSEMSASLVVGDSGYEWLMKFFGKTIYQE